MEDVADAWHWQVVIYRLRCAYGLALQRNFIARGEVGPAASAAHLVGNGSRFWMRTEQASDLARAGLRIARLRWAGTKWAAEAAGPTFKDSLQCQVLRQVTESGRDLVREWRIGAP